MNFLRLLPIILSIVVLGAHFFRAGALSLAIFSFLLLLLLFYRQIWVARITQLFLILGALEWIRTLIILIAERNMMGIPWMRMAIILGGAALFTGASALLFSYNRALKERYGLESRN